MPRKPTAAGPDTPNPLQRQYGAFLRVSRLRRGQTTREVSEELGLTDTYYRLVEAGRATLNPGLLLTLIMWLARPNPSVPEPEPVSFPRLALFVVGMQWVGAEMARPQRPKTGEAAMKTLAELNADFEKFYEQTKGYFRLEDGSDEQRRFLETVAASEISAFLRSDAYADATEGAQIEQLMPAQEMRDLPTLNLDLVLELKKGLVGRPFIHTDDFAAKWELRNASRFRYSRGLFRNKTIIISEANLRRFQYWYLAEPQFREVQLLFLSDEKSEALREEFIDLLSKCRRVANEKELSDSEIAKIDVRCVPNSEEVDQLLTLRPPNKTDAPAQQFDAYWALARADLEFAFIGLKNKNMDVWNLSLADAVQKGNLFKSIWDKA